MADKAPDDLGFEKVEGDIKLIDAQGGYTLVHISGHHAGGSRQEVAEYIKTRVLERLPGPPSEIIALKSQVKALEKAAGEKDAKINQLEVALKAKK